MAREQSPRITSRRPKGWTELPRGFETNFPKGELVCKPAFSLNLLLSGIPVEGKRASWLKSCMDGRITFPPDGLLGTPRGYVGGSGESVLAATIREMRKNTSPPRFILFEPIILGDGSKPDR